MTLSFFIRTPLSCVLLSGSLLLFPSTAFAGDSPAPEPSEAPPPAQSKTPEAAVKGFLEAQNQRDDEKAYSYLSDEARQRRSLKDWADQGHRVRSTFSAISIVAGEALLIGGHSESPFEIEVEEVEGDQAVINVTRMLPVTSTLYLSRKDGNWAIDIHKSLLGGETEPAPSPTPDPPAPQPETPATPPTPDATPQCRANLRQIGIAIQVYALDHGGQLPDAATWTDQIAPYLSNLAQLKCPPDSLAESSYAMNANLSGMKLTDIPNAGKTILLYPTTTTEKNASGTGQTLPDTPPLANGYLVLYASGEVDQIAAKPEIR